MSFLGTIRDVLRDFPDAGFDTVVMSPDTEIAMLNETYGGSYPTVKDVVYGLAVVIDDGCPNNRIYFYNSKKVTK